MTDTIIICSIGRYVDGALDKVLSVVAVDSGLSFLLDKIVDSLNVADPSTSYYYDYEIEMEIP